MIELLNLIRHKNGFLVEPSEIVDTRETDKTKTPRERSFRIDGDRIHVYAETETLVYLIGAIKEVVGREYTVKSIKSDVAGCGTIQVNQKVKPLQNTAGEENATAN